MHRGFFHCDHILRLLTTYTFLSFVSSAFTQRATFFTIEGFLTLYIHDGQAVWEVHRGKVYQKVSASRRVFKCSALWRLHTGALQVEHGLKGFFMARVYYTCLRFFCPHPHGEMMEMSMACLSACLHRVVGTMIEASRGCCFIIPCN